jgi:hypothetical protein
MAATCSAVPPARASTQQALGGRGSCVQMTRSIAARLSENA